MSILDIIWLSVLFLIIPVYYTYYYRKVVRKMTDLEELYKKTKEYGCKNLYTHTWGGRLTQLATEPSICNLCQYKNRCPMND